MARSTQRLRLDLSSPEGGGGSWEEVRKGKGRRRAALPPNPPPAYRQYRLLSHQEPSPFLAIRGLERSHPDVSLRVTGSSRTGYLLCPQDEETAFLLARIAREGEEQFGITLGEVVAESRGVVLLYPVGFSLDPIKADPRVTFARRCTYSAGHGRKEPTRQVMVTFAGPLPIALDLGSWGVYSVRRYTSEPLRCFKCQAFGHVQKHCGARELCAVCSGRHPTSECISALRGGERRNARCPNCGKGHHAWSKLCPERLRRLPPSSNDGHLGHRENADTKPLPAASREESHEASQRPTALASPAHDTTAAICNPALPPSPQRRRKRSKAKAASPEPAPVTFVPPVPKPPTAEVAVQTDPLPPPPPPPQLEDAGIQAAPTTYAAAVQASPKDIDDTDSFMRFFQEEYRRQVQRNAAAAAAAPQPAPQQVPERVGDNRSQTPPCGVAAETPGTVAGHHSPRGTSPPKINRPTVPG